MSTLGLVNMLFKRLLLTQRRAVDLCRVDSSLCPGR